MCFQGPLWHPRETHFGRGGSKGKGGKEDAPRPVTPLNLDEALEVIRTLVADGIEALAVCLLHSFRNAAHELLLKRLVAEHFPHITCSLSCEVMPEIREYERTSTTVANVYV